VETAGITRLVNEKMNRPGAITIHNLNGHAVMIKTAAEPTASPDIQATFGV
jgi:hypothetical protein